MLTESPDGVLPFRLSRKNYRDLSDDTQTPRLLVVLELPKDDARWMTVTREDLILRRRAYWLSLQEDCSDVRDQQSVTVRIPKQNVLDVEAMRELMERSRKGDL